MMTAHYEIKIQGQLDKSWTDWFDGMAITEDEDSNTLLSGEVIDQSALHGLLKKIRDLGLIILVVQHIEGETG